MSLTAYIFSSTFTFQILRVTCHITMHVTKIVTSNVIILYWDYSIPIITEVNDLECQKDNVWGKR